MAAQLASMNWRDLILWIQTNIYGELYENILANTSVKEFTEKQLRKREEFAFLSKKHLALLNEPESLRKFLANVNMILVSVFNMTATPKEDDLKKLFLEYTLTGDLKADDFIASIENFKDDYLAAANKAANIDESDFDKILDKTSIESTIQSQMPNNSRLLIETLDEVEKLFENTSW